MTPISRDIHNLVALKQALHSLTQQTPNVVKWNTKRREVKPG